MVEKISHYRQKRELKLRILFISETQAELVGQRIERVIHNGIKSVIEEITGT
jgi:hypothetical protein